MPDEKDIIDTIAPEPEVEELDEALDTEDTARGRDEHGRFTKAAPESEPETEPEQEPEPEPEPEKAPEMVPVAVLTGERERYRREAQELRDKVTRMETLYEKLQTPKEEAPGVPAYEEDPDGYYKGTIERLEGQVSALTQGEAARTAETTASSQEHELLSQYANSVRAFSVEHTDFQQAYDHLAKSIDADLQARGYEDPTERANAIQYEEGMLVGRALKAGKNPAELIYGYAKTRGYAGQNGAAAEQDKLARLEKGGQAAKTLSGTKGRGETTPTLERLAELNGDEFDREWEKAKRSGMLG